MGLKSDPLIKLARNSRRILSLNSFRIVVVTSTIFAGVSPRVIQRAVLHSCRYLLCGIWRFRGWGSGGGSGERGVEPRRGGGGVATAACLAAPCLPGPRSPEARCLATPYWSHPVSPVSHPLCPTWASPRVSLLRLLSLSPLFAFSPSSSLPLPLYVTFLSRLLRETYFSLYNFTSHARCSSRCRACSVNQAESFSSRRSAGLFLFGCPSQVTSPVRARSFLSLAPIWNFCVFPVSFREAFSARCSPVLQASLSIHGYLISVCNLSMREIINFYQFI